jgi:hypothetical protein
MNQFDKSLAALEESKNEPIKWLLGGALRRHAEMRCSHFLLEALAQHPRSKSLVGWCARIHQFRALLLNADEAPRKAFADVNCGPKRGDADGKLKSLMAEIMAVIHLSGLGYTDFEVLLPEAEPTPDFSARIDGKEAAVEVKNLREPQDMVRTVAGTHWQKLRATTPEAYNFRVLLRHSHRGPLGKEAQKRLRSLLDQLPKIKRNPFDEVLPGKISIRFERIDDPSLKRSAGEAWMLRALASSSSPGQLIVASAVGEQHLSFHVTELQSLFLKVLRTIMTEVWPKFFGELARPEVMNVVAMRWEPPELFYDRTLLTYTQEHIEKLFGDFGLQLKPIIFCDPEIPWDLIRQYE